MSGERLHDPGGQDDWASCDPRESERGQGGATGVRRDEAARQRNREQAGKLRKGEARRSEAN